FLAPLGVAAGAWQGLAPQALLLAALSGLFFALASLGLYRAFAIGPVRLVAPITGAYPMLSVGLAAAHGNPVGLFAWLGVCAVVAGLALVARQEEEGGSLPVRRIEAIGWAVLAAMGYALTFRLAHMAAQQGAELPVTLVARLTALAAVGLGLLARQTALAPALRLWKPLALMGLLDVAAVTLVISAANLPKPEYASVTSSLFGMFTILLAWRFLRESMRPLQWLGVLVVFAGIGTLAAA
ncbi:MAG TPA: DMT family transporter, partial [Paracoccaceae bacterium]